MLTISVKQARRLALCKAGLLKPEWVGLPAKAAGGGKRAVEAALKIIEHFGYLQLDTVAVCGVRSHVMVLHSRLEGFDLELGECLLQPGKPTFEYWGHEVCWLPMALYPAFAFRRKAFQIHPWWGDLISAHPSVAANLRDRIRAEGPLRALDMEGRSGGGWWQLKLAKKVATAMWSAGELAIRERARFQRVYDLSERVIPAHLRERELSWAEALPQLLLIALRGHGWATAGTLAQTWRLRNCGKDIQAALQQLQERGRVFACDLQLHDGGFKRGWICADDLEPAERLLKVRPRKDRGVLLSPFDPVLWDRARVAALFQFDQVLEIFKPASKRVYGYYCLPILAGEHLVARVDLKAHRKQGRLDVLALHYEKQPDGQARAAVASALQRYSQAVQLDLNHGGRLLEA